MPKRSKDQRERSRSLVAPAVQNSLLVDQRVSLARGASIAHDRLAFSPEPLRLAELNAASLAQTRAWMAGDPIAHEDQAQRLAHHLLDAGILIEDAPERLESLAAITVIIIVRDDHHGVEQLLSYFASLAVKVVVVDDGSIDKHALAEVCDHVTLIRHDHSRGPSAARNTGIRAAATPWVFLVDSDVDMVDFDLGSFAGWTRRDDVAVVAPRVTGSIGPSLRERFDRHHGPLDLGSLPGRIGARRAITFVPSAAMLLRVGIIDDPFDESLSIGEDVDLIWRLDKAGWTLLYRPEHRVTHRTRPTWAAWLLQRYRYARAAADLSEHHGEEAAPLRGSALTVGAWVLALSGYRAPSLSAFSLAKRRLDASLDRFGDESLNVAVFTKAALRPGPRLARQLIRSYGPGLVMASIVSKRIRFFTLRAIVLGGLERWWRSERTLDPLRFLAVSTMEDLAYGAGLAGGALRRRSLKALTPRLTWKRRD